jgi:hypothetical protein
MNESIHISKSFCVSDFGKMEVTSTPAEISFFKALALLNCKLDFIFTYIPNLDIPPKILRGAYLRIFKKTLFYEKRVSKYVRLTVLGTV